MPTTGIPPAPPPRQAEIALLHDARAVHDITALRFGAYEADGVPAWILASVIPGPRSGSATIPGAFLKAETGELVMAEAQGPVVIKEGRWKAVAAARPHQRCAEGDYSWTEPLVQQKRGLDPEDCYSPFAHGGMILCRPSPGRPGLGRFGTVSLLFPDWGQYVSAAADSARLHGELSAKEPGDTDRLAGLFAQENPLIAVLAFRGLMTSKGPTPDRARMAPAHSDGPSGAILAYLAITSPEAGAPSVRAVVPELETPRDVGTFRSLALGAFAASLFHPADREILSRSRAMLSWARERFRERGVVGDQDRDLLWIFEKMEVRP
jgi:hypothetical protein